MNVVLISTYDLGHQPLGLASPAAWLAERGHSVDCVDLAVGSIPSLAVREANVVAFYLPMHTATRLAVDAIGKVGKLNPDARLIAYGLYAPLNGEYLRSLGVSAVAGGEYEQELVNAIEGRPSREVSLDRLSFPVPLRAGLPVLARYARLHVGGGTRIVGYTEASRGCKHRCRHCPVVPVYNGAFRIVPREVVLADIRQQVAAGAGHITFGDPDFFNGPGHAMAIVRALNAEFPGLSYDVTIKVEHLLARRDRLGELAATGCLFVTTAVESVDDAILARLEKGHTRRDFGEVAALCRAAGLTLSPTFVPFTPWTTLAGYRDLLRSLVDLELVDNVASIQLALRLLIPPGSRLLELEETRAAVTRFDQAALLHRWSHPDPAMDQLSHQSLQLVSTMQNHRKSRREIFARLWALAHNDRPPENFDLLPRAAIPYLDEPWYC